MRARLALPLFALAFAPACGLAQTPTPPPSGTMLEVSATGEARAVPDMATVVLSCQSTAPRAAEAMAANAAKAAAVIASLRAGGIAAADLQTSGLTLEPQYANEEGQPPRLTGYQASEEVTATVRDLKALGGVIDRAAAAGAGTISGVSFALAAPRASEDMARLDAVKALEDKAALYARATGMRIVRLVRLSEGSSAAPPFRPMAGMALRAAAPTPIEPGSLIVRVEADATFELARP